MTINRRTFLKGLGTSTLFSTLPVGMKLHASTGDYQGKLLVTVQADGGWDVTSFCDPKVNTPGELDINNWANSADPETAGNITYAPVAGNQAFFQKYYRDMLVINGIDAQTNSHTVGVTHNWSGRLSAGFPSITAQFASVNAPNLPMSYVNNGGYAETSNLVRYTRLEDVQSLQNIIFPNAQQWDTSRNWMHPEDWQLVEAARAARMSRLAAQSNLTPRQATAVNDLINAKENSVSLTNFADTLNNAGELQEPVNEGNNLWSTLRRQAQIALLAMQSGVCCAADIVQGGFDTHTDHDANQYWNLAQLTSGIDYLWEYAEELGLADRLVVVIASDFGRTNFYNATNGKDHWPIGSAIIMERNVNWTNRVFGETDPVHNAYLVGANGRQSSSGSLIHPKHVMYNLRRYLELEGHGNLSAFPLSDATDFDFFAV